jgi:hypothetical protein
MAVYPAQAAKRALVILLRTLATSYNLILDLNRDSSEVDVNKAFKKVAAKVHPDKGGATEDAQRLNAARDAWRHAGPGPGNNSGSRKHAKGHPAKNTSPDPAAARRPGQHLVLPLGEARKDYRIQGEAVLLTYQSWPAQVALAAWFRFLSFVAASLGRWTAKRWTATLETNGDGSCHVHLMLQFPKVVDRTSASFVFEGKRPNVSSNDYCGEGCCKKKMQQSISRGMFYVWADKIGTQRLRDGSPCVAGNYQPCWTECPDKYQVLGAWPEKLWKQRKLTSEKFAEYLFLTRDGVMPRKRNLDAVREHEQEVAEQALIEANTKRLRSNPALYKEFPPVPAALGWLALFSTDRLRYPILLVLGASFTGKTEWVKSLFKNPLELKVGALTTFPEGLRLFDRTKHDAIILDDVRDLAFLATHQDKLQGKYDAQVEFATTPGGMCAYTKYLFAVPVAVTANFSTLNLNLLRTHDWLSNDNNRLVVEFPQVFATAS